MRVGVDAGRVVLFHRANAATGAGVSEAGLRGVEVGVEEVARARTGLRDQGVDLVPVWARIATLVTSSQVVQVQS